jgi:hypothetical protein
MATPLENYESLIPDDTPADIEMASEIPIVQIPGNRAGDDEEEAEGELPEGENGLPFGNEAVEYAPARVTYIDYLKSPVIGLLVGQGDEQALLTAHQALLTTSPWFADACAKFSDEVSVSCLFLGLVS